MRVDTSALVTQEQFSDVIGALEALVVQRSDLAEIAGAIEGALPDLIRRHQPVVTKCATPVRWVFDLLRDERTGLVTQILATPGG